MRNNQKRMAAQTPELQSAPPASPGGLSFVVPTEFVVLPSKGKFYSADHPLHNKETIEIKYMTAKDEDILSSTSLIENGLLVDRLFESIIVEDINPKTLLLSDRNAIMIAARASAYGNAYEAGIVCNNCGASQKFKFDLKKTNHNKECFDQKFLKKNNIQYDNDTGLYSVQLPALKCNISIKMLTGEDEDLTNQKENLITSNLSKIIHSVNGDDSPEAVEMLIDNLLASDSMFLRLLIPSVTPSIDLKQDFTCKECNHIEEREVPLTAAFFWPG